ncbi:hypothetical protein M758_10G149500 [Ceratodon purpureus]|nr:hypothetical protein M758_10G149500 [Ceratodon purpureus]
MRTAGACSLLVHLLLYLQTIQLIPIHGITSQADSRSVVLSFPESRDNVASRSSILESGQWALSLCKIVATPLQEQPMIKRTSWTHGMRVASNRAILPKFRRPRIGFVMTSLEQQPFAWCEGWPNLAREEYNGGQVFGPLCVMKMFRRYVDNLLYHGRF